MQNSTLQPESYWSLKGVQNQNPHFISNKSGSLSHFTVTINHEYQLLQSTTDFRCIQYIYMHSWGHLLFPKIDSAAYDDTRVHSRGHEVLSSATRRIRSPATDGLAPTETAGSLWVYTKKRQRMEDQNCN